LLAIGLTAKFRWGTPAGVRAGPAPANEVGCRLGRARPSRRRATMFSTRVALLALPLMALPASSTAGEKKAPALPSAEVVKAWRKAGLELGWYGVARDGVYRFNRDRTRLTGAVPGFRPVDLKTFESLPKLPDPGCPFALELLAATRVTDAGAKEIKGLR